MAKIVLAPYGSLGDIHPFLALALELRERGHEIVICTLEPYREKITMLGFEFHPLRPEFDPEDKEIAKAVMDTKTGTETLLTEYMLPSISDMYEDLFEVCEGVDLLIPGEIVYAAQSVAEKLDLRWISTALAPLSMFSAYDGNVYPNAEWLRHFNFLGRPFHGTVFWIMSRVIGRWLKPYRKFRREIGLSDDHDPIVKDKHSPHLNLAMFSRALGRTRPDWHSPTLQTGFCFYDGQKDLGVMPTDLETFLDRGETPIVFTLGSAAVMDPRDFFDESIKAAKILNRRAVMLYGIFNEPPIGLDDDRVAFDYAPYSKIFPRAACVVHQGGVGTTAQVLRAGVPHLIMPFSHDQPDNAARCERLGVAITIARDRYSAGSAAKELRKLLSDKSYEAKAREVKGIIAAENGTKIACDAIEDVLRK
ncbi:MAG: glycosyltransferase family 1 protein [Pyrinomonadaceae bacterium]|nr:glycosyltransferase family 1 protein [Pyrinomonadaceae bacterium]